MDLQRAPRCLLVDFLEPSVRYIAPYFIVLTSSLYRCVAAVPFIFIIYCLMCVPSVVYCLREWNVSAIPTPQSQLLAHATYAYVRIMQIDVSEVARRIVRGSDSEYNRAVGRNPTLLHPDNVQMHISPIRQPSDRTQELDTRLESSNRVPSAGSSLRNIANSRGAAVRTTTAPNPLARVPFDPQPSSNSTLPNQVSQRTMMATYRSTTPRVPPLPNPLPSSPRSPSARPTTNTGRTPLKSTRV
jgi:hypothetical protein